MNIALLFEQSGTFKNQLKSIGHNAKDFDINNEFNETDYQVDLFKMILETDLNTINKADLVFAFFPCTYFSDNNELIIKGVHWSMKTWSDSKKATYISNRLKERETFGVVLKTLVKKIKVPCIIENPNSKYIRNFCKDNNLEYIVHTRGKHGDFYNKPTIYILLNGARITELDIIHNERHITIQCDKASDFKGISRKLRRSLISELYVKNLLQHTFINNINIWFGGD